MGFPDNTCNGQKEDPDRSLVGLDHVGIDPADDGVTNQLEEVA